MINNNRIQRVLLDYSSKLKDVSDSPQIDIECLLTYILQVPKSHLYTWPERLLMRTEFRRFKDLFKRRLNGEPVAYLIGKQSFWDLELSVTNHTFIPRSDTEVLIREIFKKFDHQNNFKLDVLDLGTGSGAIALSLALSRPSWKILATECCTKAFQVALKNRKDYSLSNVELLEGDWYAPINNKKFDIIVSNPPYISKSDINICPYVRKYEPAIALFSKSNGLEDIKHIIRNGRKHLKNHGFIIIEHGFSQAHSVANIFKLFKYNNIKHHIDLNQNMRAVSATADF